MERPDDRVAADDPANDESAPPPVDDGDASTDGSAHRMVEAGVGADVPMAADDTDLNESAGGDADELAADPDGGAPPSEPPEAVAEDAEAEHDETENGPTDADGNDVPPEIRDLLADDGAAAADDAATDQADDAATDQADREAATDQADREAATDQTDATRPPGTVESGTETPTSHEPSSAARPSEGTSHTVEEHRPADPTDLARPDDAGRIATPAPDEESEPAAEAEPVSVRSEMSPALAERQAFVSLLLALVIGGLLATLGNVLQLTRWQTMMVLVSAGIVVLLIATFVVFRAMLAAAERNDEPYRTAYTHPLFMFLFIVTTTVTALFVGYVSRLVT